MLRLTRLHVLSAANTCEDLLTTWKASLEVNSQKLRWPLLKHIMSGIFGVSVSIRSNTVSILNRAMQFSRKERSKKDENTSGISKEDLKQPRRSGNLFDSDVDEEKSETWLANMMKNLNAGEKCAILEEIRTGLYRLAGEIQLHLDSLDDISLRLHSVNVSRLRSSSLSSPSQLSLSRPLSISEAAGRHAEWASLHSWTTKSSSLCAKAVEVMSSSFPSSVAAVPVSANDATSKASDRPIKSEVFAAADGYYNHTLVYGNNVAVKKKRSNDIEIEKKSISDSGLSKKSSSIAPFAKRVDSLSVTSPPLSSGDESEGGRDFSLAAGKVVNEETFQMLRLSKNSSHNITGDISIANFYLNGTMTQVIEACFVREKALALAIEAKGGELELMNAWEPIDVFDSKFEDNGDEAETWYSKCLYKCGKRTSRFNFLGTLSSTISSVAVFQLLTILGPSKEMKVVINGSAAPQAVFILNINVTHDSSYPLQKENDFLYYVIFEFSGGENRDSVNASTPAATSVRVTLKVPPPFSNRNIYSDSAVMKDVKSLVMNWKIAAQVVLSRLQKQRMDNIRETSWATKNTHLCSSESRLLKSLYERFGETSSSLPDNEPSREDTTAYSYDERPIQSNHNTEVAIEEGLNLINSNLPIHRNQWRTSGSLLRDLSKITATFIDRIESIGLKKKEKRGLSPFSFLHGNEMSISVIFVSS